MICINDNYNYQLADKIFTLKQKESDTIMNVVNQLFEIFHMIYNAKNNKKVYFLSKEIKFTKEVDPSYYLSLKYAISTIQTITVDIPLIRNGDCIMINGNLYNPMLQLLDKPLIIKKKNDAIVLMTNLGNIYSTPIVDDDIIRISLSINKRFNPPAIVWFLGFIGPDVFEEMTGCKLVVDEEDMDISLGEYLSLNRLKFDTTNLKPEYDDPKFHILLNQLKFLSKEIQEDCFAGKLDSAYASDLINPNRSGWSAFLSCYDGSRMLTKIAIHQMLLPRLDIFSANFMKHKDVVKETLRAFSKNIQPLDLKDINMKRFRVYEILLIPLMKHLYNLAMNSMYNKTTTVTKDKRIRIYDTAASSNLVNYDSSRNNSIMRLSERTKVSQTGEGGYTADMFIGPARDIHESQYGTICPINTPDREKCGVTLYLAMSHISKFNEMYYWPKKSEHKSDRLPLRSLNEYDKYIAEEEIRLEKERQLKQAEQEKKQAAVDEAIQLAKEIEKKGK